MKLAFHEQLYTYGRLTSYFVFILVSLGLWKAGQPILDKMQFVLSLYIALFLVYSFNPYTKKRVSEFGRGIAFSAGVLMLLTHSMAGILKYVAKPEEIATVFEIGETLADG